MRQRRFARGSEPEDDGLNAFDGPLQRLGADTMVITNDDPSKVSQSMNMVIHTIRDQYSGMAVAIPSSSKSYEVFYKAFKHFGGLVGERSPDVLVKSDAAGEIIKAVEELGWHAEPSLAQRWPHNAKNGMGFISPH